ncbi:helix-turn-helix transcriptional regulator [Blastococcus goldschmidtiae]|uniref:Helix-turn-helix transcriptional regulator n=1 Tax=Blastococcus goldschmidtiae TaxID=3075546 RepID=A0ABU2K231_9ACTN|nr:helix-turn-helix transcriptional regulator [Blastococcus sp. DSM 46792]MDT0274350.1 helix-turn-helix transcriptional regulator [Blastococcus sp. DSM 46792]
MTTQLAPPGRSAPPPRPWPLRVSTASSFLAAAAGGVGVLAALADGDALRGKLTAEATEADPGLAADTIADGVTATTGLVRGSVAGQTYREIGGRLFISAKTVEHHVSRIRQRLGASNRSDLLARLRFEIAQSD